MTLLPSPQRCGVLLLPPILCVALVARGDGPGDNHPDNVRRIPKPGIDHPYGRSSNADKFAGKTDMFEALESARRRYVIDDDRISVVMPRRLIILWWAANWVGPGRARKSTQPGAGGGVEFSPFEFLDRLADLIP